MINCQTTLTSPTGETLMPGVEAMRSKSRVGLSGMWHESAGHRVLSVQA